MIDDTLSVGGTIAALKGYIANNGGQVIGSTVMTAYDTKVDIVIQPNMLQSLQQKQGLNDYWRYKFGYSVDKLTQQEAGHLRKPTLEQIKERIEDAQIAKQEFNISENKELNYGSTTETQFAKTRNPEVSDLSDGRASGRVERTSSESIEISQRILQQVQTAEPTIDSESQQSATLNDVAVFLSLIGKITRDFFR